MLESKADNHQYYIDSWTSITINSIGWYRCDLCGQARITLGSLEAHRCSALALADSRSKQVSLAHAIVDGYTIPLSGMAKATWISRETIWRYVALGWIDHVRVGKKIMLRPEAWREIVVRYCDKGRYVEDVGWRVSRLDHLHALAEARDKTLRRAVNRLRRERVLSDEEWQSLGEAIEHNVSWRDGNV